MHIGPEITQLRLVGLEQEQLRAMHLLVEPYTTMVPARARCGPEGTVEPAFGSTEYRPDAAERWAEALARVLDALGTDHWLIWTSRPAPLKAGLRRMQRERQAERFPAPHQVVVDATDLDLAEKTMILFRHAKTRGASTTARGLVRQAALLIVDHPHFTPERIRRFVSDRLDVLAELVRDDGEWRLWVEVERELSMPTEAMRTSFAALSDEHRELLMSLLDAPAGLIAPRELARIARRHRAGLADRSPDELIDRLTDHFLRVTPLGIDWVHPSWRDLVIEQLAEDAAARRRFLAACGVDGVVLALSREGGIGGERTMPLLRDDADWDVLGSRVSELGRSVEDHDLARIMVALREALEDASDPGLRRELTPLARSVLTRSARRWDAERRAVAPFLLEAWYTLNWVADGRVVPPTLAYSWVELHPGTPAPGGGLARAELVRADEWLALAHVLARYDPDALAALGFFGADRELLKRLIRAIRWTDDPDCQSLAKSVLVRIQEIALDHLDHRELAGRAIEAIDYVADTGHWWVPEDLPAPPSHEPVPTGPVEFTRDDVDRVLSDL